MKRHCKSCNTTKDLNEFHVDKNKKHGRKYTCGQCVCARKPKKLRPVRSTAVGLKICKTCGVEKTLKNFSSEKNGLFGKRGSCKTCDKISRAPYLEKNRERMRKRDRDKYKSLPPKEKKEYILKKSKQNCERPNIVEWRRQYNRSDKGIFNRYKLDAMRRRYSFDLTFEQFRSLINSPCYYCGDMKSRGVDRFDNTKGYSVKNSVPCCSSCNEMKMDSVYEKWIVQMKKILKHRGEL